MRLWIDCEWNDYQGELISMALVDEDGREWYEVVSYGIPTAWVAEHVIPNIQKPPTAYDWMQDSLYHFLSSYDAIHIIADWPEDISHFCQALITGPGDRINTPVLTMEVRRDIDSDGSAVPHQALADAREMRRQHLALERKPSEGED